LIQGKTRNPRRKRHLRSIRKKGENLEWRRFLEKRFGHQKGGPGLKEVHTESTTKYREKGFLLTFAEKYRKANKSRGKKVKDRMERKLQQTLRVFKRLYAKGSSIVRKLLWKKFLRLGKGGARKC